ncbi:MAG: NAD(P)/FAD-dependent oxidoreductase [Dongiaceae bacterium]
MSAASSNYDVAIIGGGHNGLVAAACLARAGIKTILLEAADAVGGAARGYEFHPGFKVSGCAQILNLLRPEIVDALRLGDHGLRYAASDLATLSLLGDGQYLALDDKAALAQVSAADAENLPDFRRRMIRYANALAPSLLRQAPRMDFANRANVWELARFGLRIRMLGRRDMRELLRIIGMNAYDLVTDEFENETLKASIALDAVMGNFMGPRSPNSVYTYLYRMAGSTNGNRGALALPAGGVAAVMQALAAAARSAGAEIRTGSPVARVLVKDERATGVVLDDGTEIASRIVLSNADPKTSLLNLLGPEHLDTEFVRRTRHFRDRGTTAKLHLALDALPDSLRNLPKQGQARFLLTPGLLGLERAFDACKYRTVPDAPPMEIVIPTLSDPSLAPEGKHVLSANVQYVPYALAEGNWDGARAKLREGLIASIDTQLPGIKDRIVGAELLTPADIEAKFRLGGGHWHQGEISLDQIWTLRPVPGFVQYRMPVAGFYLCGAGTHPGGGITGAPGWNAAQAVIADLKTEPTR